MKYHYLKEPTEKQIEEEELRFEDAVGHYVAAERMKIQKREGHWPSFTMGEIEKCCEHNFNKAVSITPTIFQIELYELLNDNDICQSC